MSQELLREKISACLDQLEGNPDLANSLFDYIKEAAMPPGMGQALGKGVMGGLGAGIGVGIPAMLLMHHAQNKAKETMSTARNQALLTALGLGGISAGLYGAHKAMAPDQVETETQFEGPNQQPMGREIKRTKLSNERRADLVSQLGTVFYLDEVFHKEASTEKIKLNREFGLELVKELFKEAELKLDPTSTPGPDTVFKLPLKKGIPAPPPAAFKPVIKKADVMDMLGMMTNPYFGMGAGALGGAVKAHNGTEAVSGALGGGLGSVLGASLGNRANPFMQLGLQSLGGQAGGWVGRHVARGKKLHRQDEMPWYQPKKYI